MTEVRKWINNLLVADLFLVIAGFIWFFLATVLTYFGVPIVYKLWIQLWYPLFQPALGVLMLGAIVSGIWGWWAKRSEQGSDRK